MINSAGIVQDGLLGAMTAGPMAHRDQDESSGTPELLPRGHATDDDDAARRHRESVEHGRPNSPPEAR